ncbi:MAG: glycosyltransferase family 4 protein [Firmicutes bacterium]|nr:glycosyltransferase family 4 protein [Bacillota bacterium]
MQILMLSWEYPPRSVGGLGQHVYELSRALSRQGQEVHVITCGIEGAAPFEVVDGVKVHRVQPYTLHAPDLITWVLQLNLSMLEYAIRLINTGGGVDLIHAHDWLTAYAGRALKHAYRLPLVATIHATEYGRNHGLHNDQQRYISGVEWWLTYEAWRVICCSYYMKNEVKGVFQLPDDKIRVIPNGVNPQNFVVSENEPYNRDDYAHPSEKIVFYVGRLVHEKGVQVLLEAAPKILASYPRTKFIIAGRGPNENYLKHRAQELGISNSVYFTGYIDDQTRNRLYSYANVAVFPSLYEPFGIVALEAMAARTPVVVSDTGGLAEIIEEGVDGLKAHPGSSDSLAARILEILYQPHLGQRLREKAYSKVVRHFNWEEIAEQTMALYQEVRIQYAKSIWAPPNALENALKHSSRYRTNRVGEPRVS